MLDINTTIATTIETSTIVRKEKETSEGEEELSDDDYSKEKERTLRKRKRVSNLPRNDSAYNLKPTKRGRKGPAPESSTDSENNDKPLEEKVRKTRIVKEKAKAVATIKRTTTDVKATTSVTKEVEKKSAAAKIQAKVDKVAAVKSTSGTVYRYKLNEPLKRAVVLLKSFYNRIGAGRVTFSPLSRIAALKELGEALTINAFKADLEYISTFTDFYSIILDIEYNVLLTRVIYLSYYYRDIGDISIYKDYRKQFTATGRPQDSSNILSPYKFSPKYTDQKEFSLNKGAIMKDILEKLFVE